MYKAKSNKIKYIKRYIGGIMQKNDRLTTELNNAESQIIDDEKMPSEEDIQKMNSEYSTLGICDKKEIATNLAGEGIAYAFPIYLMRDIEEYCKLCEAIRGLIQKMDRRYYNSKKELLDFVSRCQNKNLLAVSSYANIMGEYKINLMPRSIKQSLTKILEFANEQNILLDKLLPFYGGTEGQWIYKRHMLSQSIIANLCIMGCMV